MSFIIYILIFITGICFGSFYNVVAFRLANKQSLIKPRSHCPTCKHQLQAWELIPVISWIILRGKCSNCKNKISIFYPTIELFTGILFVICYYSFGFTYDFLITVFLSSMLSITIVTDLNYYIILDEVNIFFSILIFIVNILNYGIIGACKYAFYGFIMFLFMFLLMKLGNYLFKEESLGGGDIKLMFTLGMTMPVILSFISLSLAAILALPISIYLLLKYKDKAVPFGPFLIAGFLIILFLKIDINQVLGLLKLL